VQIRAANTVAAVGPARVVGRRFIASLRVVALCAGLLVAVRLPAAAVQPREHPTLVRADPALCAGCHEELLAGHEQVHLPAAEDCTTCHELVRGDAGMTVALADDEPALCLGCHDGLTPSVERTLESPHPPVPDSCVNCHDPHAGDQVSLLASSVGEICAGCHDRESLAEVHGGQLTDATDCVSCHAPHGSDHGGMLRASHQHVPFADGSCVGCHREPFGDRIRLRARGERLCTACHGKFERPDGGSLHPAVAGQRGRAGCLSCHDPHMSDNHALLLDATPAGCATCHEAIGAQAAAESGHAPAADDCATCHAPHVAEQPALLRWAGGDLCSTCHEASAELSQAHLGADPTTLDCTGCHDAHGTGHPSLLARTLHPPLLDGCETCHEGSFDRVVDDGGSSLCTSCHGDVGATATDAHVLHAAMEFTRCVDCHEPHASARDKLVRRAEGGICADCHEAQLAGEGEVAHGVIELVGCRACHEPHGGERPKLLRAEGSALCLACHDSREIELRSAAARTTPLQRFGVPDALVAATATLALSPDGEQGHPLDHHRVLGVPTAQELKKIDTTFEGEFTCLTCHDPHKGRSEKILQWNAANSMEACVNCHPK